MPTKKNRRNRSTAAKLGELGMAVPQVVAHRVARMALAGPAPSARDRAEFTRMVQEKQLAFAQSWLAMAQEGMRVQQSLLASWVASFSPLALASPLAHQRQRAAQVRHGLARVASAGLGPVHRKAVANARRLARTRLR
jgi:hypothetical protein